MARIRMDAKKEAAFWGRPTLWREEEKKERRSLTLCLLCLV